MRVAYRLESDRVFIEESWHPVNANAMILAKEEHLRWAGKD
jgi:hypothetical protein